MSAPKGARLSLRTAMFAVFLAALGIALAVQGSLLVLQNRKIASVEATARRIEMQNRQLTNAIVRDQQARAGEFSDLRREIEAIRGASVAPSDFRPPQQAAPSRSIPTGEWVQVSV